MHSQRRRQAVGLWARIPFLVLLTCGCTTAVKGAHPQITPLTLTQPTSVSSTAISLTVGANRLPTQGGGVEEAFLPVAVTVRNTGDRTLCGGAHTAVLGDSAGASISATLPEEVVSRLFGPLASLQPLPRPAALTEGVSDPAVFLMPVQGSHGMHFGIGPGGGGFLGRAPRAPYLPPSPRAFMPPFGFPSPFASPFSAYPYSPFYRPFPYPYGYYSPYSPFSTPSPFNPPPFAPFDRPAPPLAPYGYAPYGYPPLPAVPGLPEEHYPAVDSAFVKEILSTAFASRPLALQEERSGFLFFPLPVPNQGATLLAWDWYDCATSELVTHLSIPISVEKKV